MKKAIMLLVAALSLQIALPVAAQSFSKPEDAIKYRRAAFTVLGAHFGVLGAMATGKAPYDKALAEKHAANVAVLATLPWAGFVPGAETGGTNLKAEAAKADQAGVMQCIKDIQATTQALATEAGKGLDALKASFGAAGKVVGECHKKFKA